MKRKQTYSMSEAAEKISDELGIEIGRNKLFEFLRDNNFFNYQNEPYLQFSAYFTSKTVNKGGGILMKMPLVRHKGIEMIKNAILKYREFLEAKLPAACMDHIDFNLEPASRKRDDWARCKRYWK